MPVYPGARTLQAQVGVFGSRSRLWLERPHQRKAPSDGHLHSARGGTRTLTRVTPHRILSPVRLPVPPPGQGVAILSPGTIRPNRQTDGRRPLQNEVKTQIRVPPIDLGLGRAASLGFGESSCGCAQRTGLGTVSGGHTQVRPDGIGPQAEACGSDRQVPTQQGGYAGPPLSLCSQN